MGNEWIFSSNSPWHSETHRIGNAWEIGSHTFSIKWVVFAIKLPSWSILHHMGNECVSVSISQSMGNSRKTHWMVKPEKLISGKILENPSYEENLGNWFSYFSHSMSAFFQLDSHSMVYFIICEIHGFPHQFPIAWENAAKSIELGKSRKMKPIFSLTYGHSSSIRFPSYGILHQMGNAWFFPSIFNSTGKCSRFHPVSFLVVYPQYYCFYFFQNLLIS